ncbi:MAG: hypothetical protein PVSMB1_07180 [Gemmatimonadaceae bacterium]
MTSIAVDLPDDIAKLLETAWRDTVRAAHHGWRAPETGVARRCRAAEEAGVVVTTGTAPRQWLVAGGGSLDTARAPP